MKIFKLCLLCNKKFYPSVFKKTSESPSRWKTRKYCSQSCYEKSKWGRKRSNVPWLIGKNNYQWKGNEISSAGLHMWIKRKLGKPAECVYCGSIKNLQWASISHHAHRDLNDFIPLCSYCHLHYDRDYLEKWVPFQKLSYTMTD